MYAEFNDFETPNQDWEFSVEFYPEEQAELEFYIAATQGKESICEEGSVQEVRKARGKAKRSRKYVHQRMLQSTGQKAPRVQRNFW